MFFNNIFQLFLDISDLTDFLKIITENILEDPRNFYINQVLLQIFFHILKFFLRSGQNELFFCPLGQNFFKKFISPKSSAIWDLWRILTFKIDLHPPGTSKPSKNTFLLQQEWFFEGFGVPGGCKSILNVKCLHKSYIAELFGPRVFWFSEGQKKSFLPTFWRFLLRP